MALFKPFMGNRSSLNSVEKHAGYVYFCVDDGSFHLDFLDNNGNVQRKQINANEANKLVGYNIASTLIDSVSEIPTSHAVFTAIAEKSNASHTHDDRYYTEAEIDAKLASKSDSTHKHDGVYDTKGSAAAVQNNLNAVSDELRDHTGNSNIHVTADKKSNWDNAHAHSQSAHARVDATKVADSTTNGNILINDVETHVYSHPESGVAAGTYRSVTVNTQGHITAGANPTTLSGYGITDAETKSDATKKLNEAKSYADNAANEVKNDLLNGAGAAYDTLKELGDLIDTNVDAIDVLKDVAAGKADKVHSHAISDITNLQTALDGKAASSHGTHVTYSTTTPVMDGTASVGSATTVARSDHKHPTDTTRAAKVDLDSHTGDTNVHINATERVNWNAAYTHSTSAHAPSNAEKNQNAFSNIAVSGQTTVAADTATDTVTFVGSNVSITTDATNDKVTFTVADASTSTKGVVQLINSTSSTSTTTAATPSSVKSAYDLANTAKTNAANAQAKADQAYSLADLASNQIYVGPDKPTDENVKVWINTAEEGTGVIPVLPRIANVELAAGAWVGSSEPYSQQVNISTVTASSKVDLQPTAHQIVSLQNSETSLMIENNGGTLICYAIGNKPTVNYTMQVLVQEVAYI